MKAKLINLKDKLVDTLNELTEQHWLAIFGFFMLALVIGSMIIAPLSASAYTYQEFPISVALTNTMDIPYNFISVIGFSNGEPNLNEGLGVYDFDAPLGIFNVSYDTDGSLLLQEDGEASSVVFANHTGIPEGQYYLSAIIQLESDSGAMITPMGSYTGIGYGSSSELGMSVTLYYNTGTTFYLTDNPSTDILPNNITYIISPIGSTGVGTPTECPTLEEQIADFDGSWYMFEQMLKANNYELWMKYSSELADFGSTEYSKGLSQGYQNGFSSALSGNSVEDPIDQYWNSTKDYILIAGQPYFTPNGFGSIDPYNTIGIYGEHESKLHKLDGSTQTFNGQYVTEFASTGTLGGGWYKLGATVGDEYAYEQTLTTTVGDKAYYVARVSPLGDPVEEFLVAIWVDGYEAWFVAEEYAHFGTVANNNKSYKQVYSIYMTDIRPTAQRFVNYDNPTLHETFNEDLNATLYLATFNQLNNYNVYTDGIGIVESYNNGFDAGANTTLWTDLISQPVVAFFSIPLAQVIIEGVTYTLTYGIVLGAGIVGLIVIWFLKLFSGG